MKLRSILEFKFDANGVRVLTRDGGTNAQQFNRHALIEAARTATRGPVGFRNRNVLSEHRDLLAGKMASPVKEVAK